MDRPEAFDYDKRFGLLTFVKNIRGGTTQYNYDYFGRIAGQQDAYNSFVYAYNDVDVTQVSGLTVRVEAYGQTDYLVQSYNGLGQLIKDTRIDGSITEYAYDSQGQLEMNTLPYVNPADRRELQTSYDALGRPLTVETRDSEGGTQYAYPDWQTVRVTDAQGLTTVYKLDAFGRVQSVTEAGALTTYQYLENTANPSMIITDPGGNQTVIHYDSLGRKVALDDPDMGSWTYNYDERGNLHTQTDARGVVTTLTYDLLGRLDLKTHTIPSGFRGGRYSAR